MAVAMDDEATLKWFVRMGDSVLLVPENTKYELIQLSDNQARNVGAKLVIKLEKDI